MSNIIIILIILTSYFYKQSTMHVDVVKDDLKKSTQELYRDEENFIQLSKNHEKVVVYISDNFDKLIMPFSGEGVNGRWFINQYWFTSDNHIYVTYEDGHQLFGALIKYSADMDGSESYEVVAVFGISGGGWQVLHGEDTQNDKGIVAVWPKEKQLVKHGFSSGPHYSIAIPNDYYSIWSDGLETISHSKWRYEKIHSPFLSIKVVDSGLTLDEWVKQDIQKMIADQYRVGENCDMMCVSAVAKEVTIGNNIRALQYRI